MASPKQPSKTEAQALDFGDFLFTDLFAKKKCQIRRRKNLGNLEDDIITVLTYKKVNTGKLPSRTAKSSQNENPPHIQRLNQLLQINLIP